MNKQIEQRLKHALAKLDAAFPAGDYHLNQFQNVSINELNDISCELKSDDKDYALMLIKERMNWNNWVLDSLVSKGLAKEEDTKEHRDMFSTICQCKQYCRACQSNKTGEGYAEPFSEDWNDFVSSCEDCAILKELRKFEKL